MKYILLLSLFVMACHRNQLPAQTPAIDTSFVKLIPTVDTSPPLSQDSSYERLSRKYDSLAFRYDSLVQAYGSLTVESKGLRHTLDTLSTQLFLNRYKVEKVRFYLNICLRNPSQEKFLKGWIKRAIQ